MSIEKKDFEKIKLVKEIKKEIAEFTLSNGYYHLSVYYNFLWELYFSIDTNTGFNFKTFEEINRFTDDKYKNQILRILKKYKIGLKNN